MVPKMMMVGGACGEPTESKSTEAWRQPLKSNLKKHTSVSGYQGKQANEARAAAHTAQGNAQGRGYSFSAFKVEPDRKQ